MVNGSMLRKHLKPCVSGLLNHLLKGRAVCFPQKSDRRAVANDQHKSNQPAQQFATQVEETPGLPFISFNMARPSKSANAGSSLRLMLQALGLGCPRGLREGPTTLSPGTLIVSIDFEGIHSLLAAGHRETDAQMGVSILDPSLLQNQRATSPSDPQQLIRTYHFASGSSAYVQQASEKFLFGETVRCSPCDFVASLNSLLPREANFIIVAQSIHGERAVLRHLGYHLDSDPRLSGIVDTYPMSGDVFNTQRGFGSLRRILTELGVEVNNGDLHCAGNDAHYTLQAALLLSERGYLQQCPDPGPEHAAILAAMRGLATAPVCRKDIPKLLKPDRLAEIEAREEVIRRKTYLRAELARHEAEVEEQESLGLEVCWSC